jgi:hypothetical protein
VHRSKSVPFGGVNPAGASRSGPELERQAARGPFPDPPDPQFKRPASCSAVAEFAVRIYREEGGFLAVMDDWGTVRGRTLKEVIDHSRALLQDIVTAAFPDRSRIDPAGASLVVRFSVELRRLR